ncbi:uncharacterized protein LOC141908644 [Tubulanus polymorphus]|uniref:uncharacterized protein LOC141908644 n=1 Tax=Tubulanus polymorphus TaxID=672921 RepID=UPI003DA3371C
MGCCAEVCRSIPWITLIAVIMNVLGVLLFTGGVASILEVIEEYLKLKSAKTILAIAWVVLFGLDVWYMLIAIFSSGATRDKCCKNTCSNRFNSFCIVLNMIFAYIFQLLWILLTAALVAPVLLILCLTVACKALGNASKDVCEAVQKLGLDIFANNGTQIPCTDLNLDICKVMPDSFGRAIVAFVGSLIVSLSMGVFLMAMSANFIHLKYVPKEDRSSNYAM